MNDLVKDLLKQSTYEILGVPQVDQKKFAELIVLECVEVVASRPYIDDGNWSHPSTMIRKHFGVNND